MVINRAGIESKLAEKKMSKSEFAVRCGVSRQNISTILGRGTCQPRTAGKLAEGLGVPLSEIVQGEVKP